MITLAPIARKALESRGLYEMSDVIKEDDAHLLSFDGISEATLKEIRKWEFYTRRALIDGMDIEMLSAQTANLAYDVVVALAKSNGKMLPEYGRIAWQVARVWYDAATGQ
jgi:hypothetical protein